MAECIRTHTISDGLEFKADLIRCYLETGCIVCGDKLSEFSVVERDPEQANLEAFA